MSKFYLKPRNFYVASLIFFLLNAAAESSAQNVTANKKTVFVIVHGAWGGSWAFRQVDSLMTENGCIVYRPSLTGLGERVHLASPDVSLSTHINDVVNTILFEELTDVILVGHSYGGMVITGVADSIPERIRKLVYLDAMTPDDGESVMDLMDPKGERFEKMVSGAYLDAPWVKEDQKPPKDVPHPLKTFTEPISLDNEDRKSIAATYILTVDAGKKASDDSFASSAARAEERGWEVWQMTADHNPQWSAVPELVRLLLKTK